MESIKQYSDEESKDMSSGEKQSEKERYSRDKHDRERRRSRSRTPPRRRSHGYHSSRQHHKHSPYRRRSRSPPHSHHRHSSDRDQQKRPTKQDSNGDKAPKPAVNPVPQQAPAPPSNPPALQATTTQKKKLLWSSKPAKQSWNNWEGVSLGDEAAQSKFRRLMGIKGDNTAEGQKQEGKAADGTLLKNLESQYETSRYMTHLAKGAGLGFGIGTQNVTVDPHDTDKLNE